MIFEPEYVINKRAPLLQLHLLTAVVSLMAASAVKDPADMERVLISNNFLGEE